MISSLFLTALSIGYMDLPTEAKSYDDNVRDISRFYKQETPSLTIGGGYIIDNKSYITFGTTTGTYTPKLSIGNSFNVGYTNQIKLNKSWSLKYNGQVNYNGSIKNSPCVDEYNRTYYCGDLTAWSDFEGNRNEKISLSGGISFSYKW